MQYRNEILDGDALERLRDLPDETVDMCLTSPPYFGLRDYGIAGQIGQEDSPEAYVEKLLRVFAEVNRVLKPEGTLWLNIADSYAGSCQGAGTKHPARKQHSNRGTQYMFEEGFKSKLLHVKGCKSKDMIGIPWMLAFALRDAGWYLRQDMRESGVAREEIFLSTKLWPSEYENENAVDDTLERLGVDYVDLLYIHQPAGNWLAGYRQLEKAYRDGRAKAIGISNFEGKYIAELETMWEIVPQFIQVEAHPYFPQDELRVTLDKYGIRLMAWYPLGHGDRSLIEEPIFKTLGEKYGKTSAQVILRWHTQIGFVVIPGSKNVAHIRDNLNILDFALTDEEMDEIGKLNTGKRYYTRNDAMLKGFAAWQPTYEKA